MGRIRTIKPEFFQHEALYDAEIEFELPLRLGFAGLWTQCDREGRFRWRPRQLKLNILPYDDCDFGRVLDALLTRGFVGQYSSDGEDYGYIPSWDRHQVVNNRERASELPEPLKNQSLADACVTRHPRVEHAAQGEGKGKERKGNRSNHSSSDFSSLPGHEPPYPPEFEAAWAAYPRRPGNPKKPAYKAWSARRREGVLAEDLQRATECYRSHMEVERKINTEFVLQAKTFYGSSERWLEWLLPQSAGAQFFGYGDVVNGD